MLFIQSIDQIQGEEREVILFSTLVAPKTETTTTNNNNNIADNNVDDGNTAPVDLFDELEARGASGGSRGRDAVRGGGLGMGADVGGYDSGSSSESDDEYHTDHRRSQYQPNTAAGGGGGAGAGSRVSYSTLALGHGDCLLNVGLTRAIRVMVVYYHPELSAPPEHDPKPGKRAFGWLVRTLGPPRRNQSVPSS